MRRTVGIVGLLLIASHMLLTGQPAPLRFKQLTNTSQRLPLSSAELLALDDPLFRLLLRDKANTVSLSAIQNAIQPNSANRHLFVVDETIAQIARIGSRRAVIAFDGETAGERLSGNVMLSLSFGPSGLSEAADVEAWGWDNHRERYNYYKLDGVGAARAWKFRGSSVDADLLSANDRRGTCLGCHIVGAPIMKELAFPWNNWHAGVGGSFKADYLDPASVEPNKWPAALTAPFSRLSTADRLETALLIPAFKRFNTSRLNATLKRDDATGNRFIAPNGQMTVVQGQRLLRSLFQTVEINLVSSRNTSGVHPFGAAGAFVPALDIQIPVSFFLNVSMIAGGGLTGLDGIKLTEANQFSTFAKLNQQENKELLDKFKIQLNGVRGDAHFGWFVPEVAFVDNEVVDQALKLGVITPHFLAAALAVDLETPVLSARRAELLKLIPDQFEFIPIQVPLNPLGPRNPATDLLTQAVLARLAQTNAPAGSAAAEFRALLSSADAVVELRNRVTAYALRVKTALNAPNPVRRIELERLFVRLIERRKAMLAHEMLRNLDETQGRLLLPRPSGN